jgi:hypothetical protein
LAGGIASQIPYQTGAGSTAFVANGTTGQVLTSNGTSAPSWTTVSASVSVTDDTSTNATRYPLFASATSGSLSTLYTSSTKYQFNPSTGMLTSNGLTTNSFVSSIVASTANYVQVAGAATGAAPTISAQGSDANINLNYDAKGTGIHSFRNQTGNTNFQIGSGTGAVDYCYVSGSSSGFPTFGVQGASANIGLTILSKGTQGLFFKTNGSVQQVQISHVASAVNYLQLIGAVTTSAPELSAQGSDANINLKLTPKGTGGVQFTGPLLPNNLAGTSGQVLTSAGAGAVPTWTTASGATITDDTTTNAVRYVSFTAASSGSLSTLYTSSTKLKYNPSTGALTASSIIIAP